MDSLQNQIHHQLITSTDSNSSNDTNTDTTTTNTTTTILPTSPNQPTHQLLTLLPPNSASLINAIPVVSFDPPPDSDSDPSQQSNPLGLDHAEFGFDDFNQNYRYISQSKNPVPSHSKSRQLAFHLPLQPLEEPGHWVYLSTYLSYLILILLGHVRDFFGKRFNSTDFLHLMPRDGYAALNSDFDSFYTRRLKARMDDCFARPVTGVAGRTINLIDRTTHDHCKTFLYTHQLKRTLNISSYNYLGFAQSKGYVTDHVEQTLNQLSLSVGGSRQDVGNLELHVQCEKLIAQFLGVQDSILISQGFATNSTTFPVLGSKGTLIISDELNHSSIRFGSRLSGAMIRQYKHNDMVDLEKLLRETISQGQPRTHRPWKKILVVVEGIYSMEGTIVNLPALYALRKIYKFYLFVDEAHSVGALGPRGKGVCDYYGLDPNEIDILMGTLTKSFGASGGYIAGKSSLIKYLRLKNHSSVYGESMSPPVIQQIISSLTLIAGLEPDPSSVTDATPLIIKGSNDQPSGSPDSKHPDPPVMLVSEGQERLRRLAFNARYLSSGLRKLGFIVYGDRDSPIIPLLIFHPGKMLQFSRMMLERFAIVVVVVAYPATPLLSSRVRFCVSASHTKDDIDKILIATDQIGDILGLKMSKRNGFASESSPTALADPNHDYCVNLDGSKRWSIEQVLSRSLELVEA